MTDYISRADAMSKCKNAENELTDEAERKGVRVARFIIGELPSAELPKGDLISRADAIEAVRKCKVQDIRFGNVTSNMMLVQKAEVIVALSALPSADAVIVRPKYMMHKADYEKWAEEVKKESSNIIVLPYDAEVITDDRLDVDRIYCSPQIAENVVKVVRCKDCRHIGLFSCPLADNDFQKDDDFCSWGERREK